MKKAIFILSLMPTMTFAQTASDTSGYNKDNGIKALVAVFGFGAAYEAEVFRKTYFEAGATSFIFISTAYAQVKYAVMRKGNHQIKIGIAGIYAVSSRRYFDAGGEPIFYPVFYSEYDYKRFGVGLGLTYNVWLSSGEAPTIVPAWMQFSYKFNFKKR